MVKSIFTQKRSLLVALATVAMLLTSMSASAYSYTVLGGSKSGNEGSQLLVDGNIQTKWGQSYTTGVTEAYVIFKSDRPITPSNYFLVIANDTQTNTGRNWQSWNVYAANFASDEEAVKGAEGWVLVDKKENELVPTENFKAVDYTCSEGISDTYTYFMVEVTAAVQSTDVYLQMGEFGWGTSAEFLNGGPISYIVMDGDRNNTDSEGLPKLFDDNYSTKWGNSQTEGTPQFAIFKTTRPVAPTYYCLVTGTDNYSWNHRNWRDWEIYAMNTTDESQVTRDSENWVLIDKRENVSEDVLPDYNSYEVFFTPNQEVTEAYTYFKIEIYAIMSGGGYMQMTEFFMGDNGSFDTDAQKHYDKLNIDLDKPMQKTLAEEYKAKTAAILTAADIFAVDKLSKECTDLQTAVKNSINAYDSYMNVVSQLRNHYENHTCITGEGRTVVGNYLDTEAAPSDTYPNGTYAYVINNGLLDVDAINNEAIFVNMMLEKYASDLTEGAIGDMSYQAFIGRAGFSNESYEQLIDGVDETKWCSGNSDYFIVFKADEPIAPTYYRLFTGNDTGANPDRNWKTWKIYGANFENEDVVDALCDGDESIRNKDNGWVLIDSKSNVGTDQLPAASYAAAFLYLSNPSSTPYEYFMIEISDPTGTMQMGEFSFGNGADFIITRQSFYEEFSGEDPSDYVAHKQYIEDYKTNLAKMQTTASIVDLGNLYNTLTELLSTIVTSEEYYNEFDFAVEEVRAATGYMTGDLEEYWTNFITEDIEPNADYEYGSYSYIMENRQLDNDAMADYVEYLNGVAKAALEGGFILIAGNMDTWGTNENYAKLIDKDHETKWGGDVQKPDGSWVIFKTVEANQPLFYKLTTGNDTEGNSGRNWKDWQVYGANFANDAEATFDADGWVLLDNREGVGQDRLPAANFYTVPFGFTEGINEEYTYFKVVITAAYSGNSIQMSEFEFGTDDEFDEIREGYLAEIEELSLDGIVATDSLLNAYYDAESDIYSSEDLEQIYVDYKTMLDTYDKILVSASIYQQYSQKVDALKAAIATYDESEELSTLKSYLNDEVEAGDLFPNGSAATVLGQHLLDNAGVLAEVNYMSALAKAALLKGYAAGTDITAMVTNPSFGDGAEGWNGEIYASNYNAEYTMSAAEFCNENATFHVYQTLTGLKNGYYLVGMNGGFRPQGDIYSKNYAAQLYANGNATYIQAVIDDMIPVEDAVSQVNCWLGNSIPDKPILSEDGEGTDTIGYVLWGVQSCCYAFQAGRYQNYVVAQVTDGTLTFGVKNEGTQNGGDWCGLGNTTIQFLGELDSNAATAALDKTLDGEAKLFEALYESEGFYETTDYKVKPFVNEAALKTLKKNVESAPATNADKYAAVVSNSDCFKEIYAAKNAYVKGIDAYLAVTDKWESHTELMDNAAASAYDDATYSVLEGCSGLFSSAEALQAADDLKAKYVCYIDLDETKSKGAIEITETAPFEYEIAADGSRPNIGLNKCMYDTLTVDQNILAFEYKCDTELVGGTLFYAHTSLNASECEAYGNLSAAADWKKAYISIANDYGWGKATDHWFRWDLATAGTFNISVRNMVIITKAQMEAEGGEVINTGIDNMIIENDVPETFIYNVMGQRVGNDYKGITIQGGKKFFNK